MVPAETPVSEATAIPGRMLDLFGRDHPEFTSDDAIALTA